MSTARGSPFFVQPSGQRVADQLAWAFQIIQRYDPTALRRKTPRPPG